MTRRTILLPFAPALLLTLLLSACAVQVQTGSGSSPAPSTNRTSAAPQGPTSSSSAIHTGTRASVPVASVDRLAERAVARVGPAVVKVATSSGLGSGVVMTGDGYIVTNNHVVSGAHALSVTLATGRSLAASVVGTDPEDDLAVVKVNGSRLPTATFGNSTDLKLGETVLAIGNPLGYTSTVTEGIVSALNRTVDEGQGGGSIPRAIQTSAPINPGNSGGALINLGAQVVGIPTLTAVDPEFNAPAPGIGFAIPSNTVVRIASQIIKYGKVIHSGRAALGIYASDVTPDLATQYNLPIDHGVLVARVVAHGPAQQAGLRQGDIIVKVAGHTVSSDSDLLEVLANKKPGDVVSVGVVTSSGRHATYTVKLGELPVTSNG